ncbi:MAG: transposase [Candidatus Aminicenantes bacterium]|nr:transposase [Candidatus Aminicenantes bacterium]
MQKKFDIRGRRSIRLKGWDYSTPNYYFITLCVQNRVNLFGNIIEGRIILTEIGSMVKEIWLDMQTKYSGVTVDEFVVMPNHIHGILGLHVGAGPRSTNHPPTNIGGFDLSIPKGGACPFTSTIELGQDDPGRTRGSAPMGKFLSLSDTIRQFKTWTTKKYAENMIRFHWPEFCKRLWQRNYFERIIRCEKELKQIRQYILDNPANWQNDHENPGDK